MHQFFFEKNVGLECFEAPLTCAEQGNSNGISRSANGGVEGTRCQSSKFAKMGTHSERHKGIRGCNGRWSGKERDEM
jgi:hypothetical protein